MRLPLLAVAIVLLSGRAAPAQQPLKQPVPQVNSPPQAAELQAILSNWQRAFGGVTKFHVLNAVRTMKDAIWNETTFYEGEIKFLAPRRFLVDLKKMDRGKPVPGDMFKVVCTGDAIFEFKPKDKKIYMMPMPDKKANDNTIMGFLFPDMKITEFQDRYQLALAAAPAGYEKYYYFIDILPKRPEDKANFSNARLVLNRQNFLPSQLYYKEPNGSQITWDFRKIKTADANVQPNEFGQPTLPARDWSFARAPENGPGPRSPVQQAPKK
jgi:TIGR03009 family protein